MHIKIHTFLEKINYFEILHLSRCFLRTELAVHIVLQH